MANDNAKNGARATLAAGITAGATSITLASGHGARMPAVPFNAWMYNGTDYATDPFDDPDYEIVRVTARATDTLTVIRAQEATAAAAHNTSGKVYKLVAGLTARTINYELSPGWYNAKANGLMGDGTTDDTAALQALINRLSALGGGQIYFPAGVYIIGGALQDPTGANSQIVLPSVPLADEVIMLELVGAIYPPTAFLSATTTPPSGRVYSIIKSTLTGASGTASVFAGVIPPDNIWNNVQFNVRNLIFETPANPTFTTLNMTAQIGNVIEHVLIHPGSVDLNDLPEPTHSNSYAIKLPANNHSAWTRVNEVTIFGHFNGLLNGELAYVDANFWGCVRAVVVPFAHHPSQYGQLGVYWCTYGIVAADTGEVGPHYMTVRLMDMEHANGAGQPWHNRIADIYDPSNLIHGDVKWLGVSAYIGNDHSLVKTGGAYLLTTEMGSWPDNPLFGGSTDALLDNLVSYWTLNEVSGVRSDTHGTNHLTPINTVGQNSGIVGSAAHFIKTNTARLSIATNATLETGDVSFTIAAWIRLDTLPASSSGYQIAAKIATGAQDYLLDVSTSTNTLARFGFLSGASAFVAVNSTPLSVGVWYYLIGWHDAAGDTVNIQVNNGAATSNSTTGAVPNITAASFTVGARALTGNEEYFDGRIDEVGFWKRVLTAGERTALYNTGAGLTYPFA